MPAPFSTQAKANAVFEATLNPYPNPNPSPKQAKANAIFEAHRSSPMCKPAPHADVAVKHAFVKSKYQVRANPSPSPKPNPSPKSKPSPNPSPSPSPNPNPNQDGAFKAGGSGVMRAVDKPHGHRAKGKGFDKGQMHAGIVVIMVRARAPRGAACAPLVHRVCTACALHVHRVHIYIYATCTLHAQCERTASHAHCMCMCMCMCMCVCLCMCAAGAARRGLGRQGSDHW